MNPRTLTCGLVRLVVVEADLLPWHRQVHDISHPAHDTSALLELEAEAAVSAAA
ncbi:hypothetical protein ACGFWD_22015 [Streptomyces sp. NPDC048448]|uniref:hypothetical protein n=1 Tax=Streptomyces sp. NPDC048448 TaxID=3365554 RepID=UPI003714C130